MGGRRIVSEKALAEQMSNHLPEAMLAERWDAGQMHFRPGFGYGYDGAVVYDPEAAGLPVGRNSYFWDGAAGTWFWVDPENDLLYVGMIQLFSVFGAAPAGADPDRDGAGPAPVAPAAAGPGDAAVGVSVYDCGETGRRAHLG